MTFDKKKHMIKVQGGRSYLPVSARVLWLRQDHPDWGIETEIVEINHEKQFAIFRARVTDGAGRLMATATKKEDVKGFGDWIEKAETGSVGRALSLCGFGTDGDPDLDTGPDGGNDDGGHIVDSPRPPRPVAQQRPPMQDARAERPALSRTAYNSDAELTAALGNGSRGGR